MRQKIISDNISIRFCSPTEPVETNYMSFPGVTRVQGVTFLRHELPSMSRVSTSRYY